MSLSNNDIGCIGDTSGLAQATAAELPYNPVSY